MTVLPLPQTAAAGPLQAVTLPLVALAYAVAYAMRARTLARRGAPVPRARIASFATGLLLVVVALSPPVDDLADELLVAHMAQHLVLADLAALAIVLGLPGPLLAPVTLHPVLDPPALLPQSHCAGAPLALDLFLWHTPFLYQA